jgi:Lipocalin-like domain
MPIELQPQRIARQHIAALAAVVVLALAGFSAPVPRIAPSPLSGTWTLVAADRIGADGVRRRDYGEHPHGRLIIEADGRYATQIYSEDRPRFASGDKAHATPDELAHAIVGMSAHFGTIALDAPASMLTFRIEHSAFPNWEGTEQRRRYQLRGDELEYQVPASASGDGSIAISVWRREQ